MAENEFLDASKARRWQSVALAIREGESDSDVARRIMDRFCKTLRQLRKTLPFEQLIRGLDDSNQVREICRPDMGYQTVKDFFMEAADLATNLQEKILHFMNRSLDNCLYDIPYLVSDCGGNVSEARGVVQRARRILQPELVWIAEKLAKNPGWNPQRSRRQDKPVAKPDTTKRMLGESLLAGFRK